MSGLDEGVLRLQERIEELQARIKFIYTSSNGDLYKRIEELEAEKAAIVNTYHEREMEFIADNERLRTALEQLRMAESEAVRNHVEAGLAAVEEASDE